MPRTVVMQQPLQRQFQQPIVAPPQPSGSPFAYLLIVLLSVFGGGAAAYGVSALTKLPLPVSLIVVVILYSTKMYFIRRQPPQERMMNSGLDRVVGYLVSAFFFVALAAFGGYEFNRGKNVASETRQEVIVNSLVRPPNGFGTSAEDKSDSEPQLKASETEEFSRFPTIEPLVSAQSPRLVRKEAVSSDHSTVAPTNVATSGLEGFITATLAQTDDAVFCWIAALALEVFIVTLALYNRPRYVYM